MSGCRRILAVACLMLVLAPASAQTGQRPVGRSARVHPPSLRDILRPRLRDSSSSGELRAIGSHLLGQAAASHGGSWSHLLCRRPVSIRRRSARRDWDRRRSPARPGYRHHVRGRSLSCAARARERTWHGHHTSADVRAAAGCERGGARAAPFARPLGRSHHHLRRDDREGDNRSSLRRAWNPLDRAGRARGSRHPVLAALPSGDIGGAHLAQAGAQDSLREKRAALAELSQRLVVDHQCSRPASQADGWSTETAAPRLPDEGCRRALIARREYAGILWVRGLIRPARRQPSQQPAPRTNDLALHRLTLEGLPSPCVSWSPVVPGRLLTCGDVLDRVSLDCRLCRQLCRGWGRSRCLRADPGSLLRKGTQRAAC